MVIVEATNEINATIEMIALTKDILRIKVILLLLSYPRPCAGVPAPLRGRTRALARAYPRPCAGVPAPAREHCYNFRLPPCGRLSPDASAVSSAVSVPRAVASVAQHQARSLPLAVLTRTRNRKPI